MSTTATTQTITRAFSGRRLGRLLLREAFTGQRSLLIAAIAVGGAIIVLSILTAIPAALAGQGTRGDGGEFYLNLFQSLLFIGGVVVSSLAFRELWQEGGGVFYLTLPGSLLEKYLSKLLVTSVVYALGAIVFFTVVAAAAEGLTLLIVGAGHGFFNPFVVDIPRDIRSYIAIQSVVLLGSIWFRKIALLRTVMWLVIFAVVAGLIGLLAARVFLFGHHAAPVTGGSTFAMGWFQMNFAQGELEALFGPGTRGHAGLEVFRIIGKVLLYLAAPVFWLAGWLRLREVEV